MSLLFGVVLAVGAGVTQVPCGASLGPALRDAYARPVIQLAAHCRYEVGALTLSGDHPLVLVGGPGSVLVGELRVEGASSLSLRALRVESRSVALAGRGTGALNLEDVELRGETALHLESGGAVSLRRTRLIGQGTALWAEGVEALRMHGCEVEGGTFAAVIRGTRGAVEIVGSRFRARAEGVASAAVYIRGAGDRPISVLRNRFEYLPAPPARPVAVVDVDALGVVAENTFIGVTAGLHTARPLSLGCNEFLGVTHRVAGPHLGMCARDLRPDSLDWRARIGELASAGRQAP